MAADKCLTEMYSLNEKDYEILMQVSLYASLVPEEKSKEFFSIFKKRPETTNVIDATRRPVIVAAAGLPIRLYVTEIVEK